MKHTITSNQIALDNPVFKNLAEWLPLQDWYIGSTGSGAKSHADKLDQSPNSDGVVYTEEGTAKADYNKERFGGGLKAKLNPNGSIKDSSSWDQFPDVSGVWRSPFGWNDESVKRRAPLVWDLFDYVNTKFFNNAFTLDGFPEEIAATRPMWSPKFGEDDTIPGFGTLPEAGGMHPIWTCYGIGKTGGVLFEGTDQPERIRMMKIKGGRRRTGSVGIHRDANVTDIADADGYFSILINMNADWKPSWGGDLLYYETVDNADEAPETHWKRGYGIGYADTVIPHRPGQVTCCPAAALHTASNDKYDQSRTDYLRRIMFRVRYKDLLNDDFEGT
jgi:hypothetical protein